jgi:hypothetical protein
MAGKHSYIWPVLGLFLFLVVLYGMLDTRDVSLLLR